MANYDFTKASDLVVFVKNEYTKKNRYKNGGIGRYDKDGTRQFDCCGLFKCFMWHDYSSTNAKYYGKVQKDKNCEGLIAEAKEKGVISTIPEVPGVLVYQKEHMGIYIGNGMVIESTGAKYDGKHSKIYKTYFKGSGKGCDGKRTTWTHWFKSPYLTYEKEAAKKEETTSKNDFLPARGYFKKGDRSKEVGEICDFFAKTFPAYFSKKELKNLPGNYFGPILEKGVKEFQRRTGLEKDGCIGPITLDKMTKYGFKY